MPQEFTLDTVIGEGWRCGPALGAFFRSKLGKGFLFNAQMRNFIHNGAGRTLSDAAFCYLQSIRLGRQKPAIPEQLEYNRHFREYFREHPGISKAGGDCRVAGEEDGKKTTARKGRAGLKDDATGMMLGASLASANSRFATAWTTSLLWHFWLLAKQGAPH